MKLIETANLYSALAKIKMSKFNIKFSELRKIAQFIAALKTDFELYAEQKDNLLRKYGVESETNPGNYRIKDVTGFGKELFTLDNEEIKFILPEIEFPINIKIPDEAEFLNLEDYEALQPYFNFIEEEKIYNE